ncbi:hypothetical protein DPEC_G00210470 [Dallia pectoralis]|uniref:Uncharacterized protein n=1 Tax=Dallia pectoralis TaxID=75939 RepID=A0ACC2G5U9_DALPE|nr:hypothetical protein DPEC_G00210470 [Dallia pectoralis]
MIGKWCSEKRKSERYGETDRQMTGDQIASSQDPGQLIPSRQGHFPGLIAPHQQAARRNRRGEMHVFRVCRDDFEEQSHCLHPQPHLLLTPITVEPSG